MSYRRLAPALRGLLVIPLDAIEQRSTNDELDEIVRVTEQLLDKLTGGGHAK